MATRTPWGPSQGTTRYGRGITFHSTAGHGGFRVVPTLNATMPKALRLASGWYEEDIDYVRVILAFPDRFPEAERLSADKTLRDWVPEAWEALHGRPLSPEESLVRREQAFAAAHREDFVARAAWGDWHERVPAGHVAVLALKAATGEERTFLVPKDEYTGARFVADLARHQAIEPVA